MTDEMNRLKKALREGGFPDRVSKTAFIAMMKRPDKTIRPHWRGLKRERCDLTEALTTQWIAHVRPSEQSELFLYLPLIERAGRSLFQPPAHLLEEIKSGRCVAFVGAGFSCPAIPSWDQLLRDLIDHLPDDRSPESLSRESLDLILKNLSSPLELETLGQMILNAFATHDESEGRRDFEQAIKEIITPVQESQDREAIQARVKCLKEIPFDSVITTNYDQFLEGHAPSSTRYADFLRTPHRWWSQRRWDVDPNQSALRVLKIHGDANGSDEVNPIILTRSDYRRRVYGDRRYSNFLKSLFASKTVLFLGVSFRDAYLNELRSEVLDMIGPLHDDTHPRAYAIMPSRSPAWEACFKATEGIELLTYEPTNQNKRHDGFDRWLESIHLRTCAEAQLKSCLEGRQVIWLDPQNEQNNTFGFDWLGRQVGASLEKISSLDELNASAHQDAALLITAFGYRSEGETPLAVNALKMINTWTDGRPPVIVFAGRDFAESNRAQVLRYGAHEFAVDWGELFRVIFDLFSRPIGR